MNALAVVLVAYPFLAIYRGWVLTLLWGWFVMPAFGLPALGLIYAVGISILVGMLVYQYQPDPEKKSALQLILVSVVSSTMALAFGFVWSLFA